MASWAYKRRSGEISTFSPIHLSALFSFGCTALWSLSSASLFIWLKPNFADIKQEPLNVKLCLLFYVLSQIAVIMSIYAFMIFRLYFTFKGSMYAITKTAMRCYVVAMCSFPALIFTVIVLNVGARANDVSAMENASLYAGIAAAIVAVLGNASVFHLTYTFAHRLYSLVLSQRRNAYNADIEALDEREMGLLQTVTKNTNLGILMAISITCSMTVLASMNFLEIQRRVHARFIVLWTLSLQYIGLTTSIYLGFRGNEKHYNFCCTLCQKKLTKICAQMVERRIMEQSQKLGQAHNL